MPSDTVLVVQLHLLGGPEEGHVLAQFTLVEDLVGSGEFGQAARAKWIWKYAARWSMASIRRAKGSGRSSRSSNWVKVAVGSRLDTTIGAVTTSPSVKIDAFHPTAGHRRSSRP